MSIIIAHTKVGKAYVHAAAIFDDEQDFINVVNSIVLPSESKVKTMHEAIQYMQNSFSNISREISKETYVIGESALIDEKANQLGWNDK